MKLAAGYAVVKSDEEKGKAVELLRRASLKEGYQLVVILFDREGEPKKSLDVARRLLDTRRVDAVFALRRSDLGESTYGFYVVEDLIKMGKL